MTGAVRSHLATFCAVVAVASVGLLASSGAQPVGDLSAARSAELVAKLCARGADPHLCAQAGYLPSTRYVCGRGMCSVQVIPARWPQMAEQAPR